MENAASVRRGQSVCNLNGDIQAAAHAERAPLDSRAQSLSLEKFGDQERRAFMRAHVMNSDDGWMAQRGSGARFAYEPLDSRLVSGRGARNDLDGHFAAELSVVGAVHFAHATGPDGPITS